MAPVRITVRRAARDESEERVSRDRAAEKAWGRAAVKGRLHTYWREHLSSTLGSQERDTVTPPRAPASGNADPFEREEPG